MQNKHSTSATGSVGTLRLLSTMVLVSLTTQKYWHLPMFSKQLEPAQPQWWFLKQLRSVSGMSHRITYLLITEHCKTVQSRNSIHIHAYVCVCVFCVHACIVSAVSEVTERESQGLIELIRLVHSGSGTHQASNAVGVGNPLHWTSTGWCMNLTIQLQFCQAQECTASSPSCAHRWATLASIIHT
jgi:hypothetical protein